MRDNTLIYLDIAKRLKLPLTYLDSIQCMRIALGKKKYYFFSSITFMNSSSSIYIAKNKRKLLQLLKKAGFPVPKNIAFAKLGDWHELLGEQIQNLDFPVVIKPMLDSHNSTGTVCNIKTGNELTDRLEKAFEKYNLMQVEEYIQGLKEYQVLLLKERIIGVVERIAARVVGDGVHSIKELINLHNEGLLEHYGKIELNQEAQLCLANQNRNQDSVVPKGVTVRIHYSVNRALGGTVISLGKKILAENENYLRKAARLTGLDFVGFDLLCEDINLPFSETEWVILAANFGPDISIYEYPEEGKKTESSKRILMQLIYRHPLAYLIHRTKLFFKGFYG